MMDFDYSLQYSRFHPGDERHVAEMVALLRHQLDDRLPADRRSPVLDLGCGRGYALRALRELGFTDLAGVEVSPTQAQHARQAGFDIDVVTDARPWLAERPARFGAILLLDVLEHVPRETQIPLLRAIHTALAPGGRLLMTVPNASAILASRWLHDDFTHQWTFTETSLRFVLANAGFGEVQISAEKGLGRFPRRLWTRAAWKGVRKYLIRWLWLQVYKAELPHLKLEEISFEPNLKALAFRAGA